MEWHTPVSTVTDGYFGVSVNEVRYGPAVMCDCATEDVGTELAVIVDASMELEAVVLTLPVMAGVSKSPSSSVKLSPHQAADLKHGAVHEAKLCFVGE